MSGSRFRPGAWARARRGGGVLLGALAVAGSVGACSGVTALQQRVSVGRGPGPRLTVAVAQPARAGVLAAAQVYARTHGGVLIMDDGSPELIATAVKDGMPTDAVVLPAGGALARVRDELVGAPAGIGTRGRLHYYAGAVTAEGLPFVRFLGSAAGLVALRGYGFGGPAPSGPAPGGPAAGR